MVSRLLPQSGILPLLLFLPLPTAGASIVGKNRPSSLHPGWVSFVLLVLSLVSSLMRWTGILPLLLFLLLPPLGASIVGKNLSSSPHPGRISFILLLIYKSHLLALLLLTS